MHHKMNNHPRDGNNEPAELKVVQVNLQKSRAASAELNLGTFDVALVQEPLNDKKGRTSLITAPKRTYSCNRARAAIIVNNDWNYWPADPFSTADMAVIIMTMAGGGKLFIASCYLDINKEVELPELTRLVLHCRRGKVPLVIGMDSNSHSNMWGEMETNKRGECLEDWLLKHDLSILNVGKVPTFAPDFNNKRTIIDITVGNEWSIALITNWEVDTKNLSFSDHRSINFNISGKAAEKKVMMRQYRKANWDTFASHLEKSVPPSIPKEPDIEYMALELGERLHYALDRVAPEKYKKISTTNTWWNESLSRKRLILKHVYKNRNLHANTGQKYLDLKKDFAKQIKKAKMDSWRSFCSSAESSREVSRLVQIIENPPKRLMSILCDTNDNTLDPSDSLKHLLRTHFPEGIINGPPLQETVMGGPDVEHGDLDFTGICQYITPRKVRLAFKSFGDLKSPGPDGLPPIALKNLPDVYVEYITLLYQLSLASGELPKSWGEMKVVFIPKAGKADYAIAKAYRPITLSNFLLKGLERIVQWYVLEHVVKDPLHRQHAYTKGRSCETALSTFVNDIEKSIYNNGYLLAVSLDCSGAFDCIRYSSAEESMRAKGLPENIIKWYCQLLKCRNIHAEVQGQTGRVIPARGSPQGGVLSPLIWNLIMDGFLSKYKKGPVKALGYADDVLLYVAGRIPNTLVELLQPALTEVLDWGASNGLTFNPSKTSVVLFTKRRTKFRVERPLLLGNTALSFSDSLRYLGVEIHRSLSWGRHLTARANNCKFLLMKCKNIVSQKWGMSPEKMDWIHRSIIRPKVTYGSVVWAANLTKTNKDRLTKVQRKALLPITQPLRSTPTAGLENMLGWMPLPLHAEKTGLSTYIRIKQIIPPGWDGTGQNNVIKGHLRLWERAESLIYPDNYPKGSKCDSYVWRDIYNPPDEVFDRPLCVYTDASKSGDDVGYAWSACDDAYCLAEEFYSAKEMDIHNAELMGIKEALSWIKDNNFPERKVKIFCDSQSAVHAVNSHKVKNTEILDIINLWEELPGVEIIWTKGHNNNSGNELADMLARKGAQAAKDLHYASPYVPLTEGMVKRLINERFISLWQEYWDNLSNCKISRLFMPTVNTNKHMVHKNITELQRLSQIKTGHGLFKRHLRHWNEIDDFQCSLCGEAPEDSWHLWRYCPTLATQRRNIDLQRQNGMSDERALIKWFQMEPITSLEASNEALLTPD